MKKSSLAIFALIIFLFNSQTASSTPAPESFAPLVDQLLPTVVNISTSQTVESRNVIQGLPENPFPPGSPFEEFNQFFDQFQNGDGSGPRKEKMTSLGSGFIIDASGLVVTNYHVIGEAEEITVTLQDESQYPAKLVGYDSQTDLAVLRVEAKNKKFPFVRFGDSDKARVGDWVVAIGNPFNLGGTVTAGIISARARDINAGPFDDFIQTDAAINRGNSGGPLFDLGGEVVGINSAIYSPSGGNIGIGFAIPTAMAKPIIDKLKEGKEIQRGWLGVKIQTVTKEIAESLGLTNEHGALVVDVVKDSPAEAAGFAKGDIILEFDGREISTMRKLPRFVAETEVNKNVVVKILRKGRSKTLDVKIGKLKEEEKEVPASAEKDKDGEKHESAETVLGMDLVVLDKGLQEKYKLDKGTKGVLVTRVDSNSEAYANGLRSGDVISEVSQSEVKTAKDVRNAIAEAKKLGRKSILLLINREGETIFVPLPVAEEK